MEIIKIGTAFLEGLGLILSPCILPILPIMLAGGTAGGKRRPLGIITGFVTVFTLVTLLLRSVIHQTGLSPALIRDIAFGILIVFGLVMIIEPLSQFFLRMTQRLANTGANSQYLNNPKGGFGTGLLIGATVSIVWTPCAGPLLAAVVVQTVTSQTTLSSYFIAMAFACGSATPMLIITLFGRRILDRTHVIKKHPGITKKILGSIIIISAILLGSGVSTQALASTPSANTNLIKPLSSPYPAPAIKGISAWINSPAQSLADLKNQVVLINFWTYTCSHCIRSLPAINQLYQSLHPNGLEIIGIHSPQYPFQQNINNVKAAVKRYGIRYPVAVDNQFKTFLNFKNQYWPAHYLIDRQGNVVYRHIGPGDYNELQHNIAVLLKAPWTLAFDSKVHPLYQGPPLSKTPKNYPVTTLLSLSHWTLSGEWSATSNGLTAHRSGASLTFKTQAKRLTLLAQHPGPNSVPLKILINGRPLSTNNQPPFVKNSQIMISKKKPYLLIKRNNSSTVTVTLQVLAPSVNFFAIKLNSYSG